MVIVFPDLAPELGDVPRVVHGLPAEARFKVGHDVMHGYDTALPHKGAIELKVSRDPIVRMIAVNKKEIELFTGQNASNLFSCGDRVRVALDTADSLTGAGKAREGFFGARSIREIQ